MSFRAASVDVIAKEWYAPDKESVALHFLERPYITKENSMKTTSENRKRSKKTTWIVLILFFAVTVFASAGLAYHHKQQKEKSVNGSATVVPWDINIEPEKPREAGEIILPGYAKMTMAANQKEQTISMGNPADNHCYFVIVLKLADGTVLFQSDYLNPGEGMEQITMNQELKAGTYQAVIEYKCYSLEDKSPLNGGSSEFELTVQ